MHEYNANIKANKQINYSISIGLGLAGAIESRVGAGQDNPLIGYRGAQWTGVTLAAAGLLTSIVFAVASTSKR